MNFEFEELMLLVKEGYYKAMIIVYPDFTAKLKDKQFIDLVRFSVKRVKGMNTRCLVENEESLENAKQLVGKKKLYVNFKIVNEQVLDDFIKYFKEDNRITLIPSELSLKELDEQFKTNRVITGIDSESINDFMKLWHYKPPVSERDAKINYTQLLLKELEYPYGVKDYDQMLYNKFINAHRITRRKY